MQIFCRTMDQSLLITEAPALDPGWIEHEKIVALLGPSPKFANLEDRQKFYREECKTRNAQMLAGRDQHLTRGIEVSDSTITATDGYPIKIRHYTPAIATETTHISNYQSFVIYYHGGGLRVGDLDSEDLSCRRICNDAQIRVISIEYRLMPQNPPQKALDDAWDAFVKLASSKRPSEQLILVGSSSGGQLAAQVAHLARDTGAVPPQTIKGLLLRCPVTTDASNSGFNIPERFRALHTSFSPSFETSLLMIDAGTPRLNTENLPLDANSFENLPRAFIQLCSNDLYYSDGACYALALREAGVDVQVEVFHGWPHTFWLKAPQLDQALKADIDMIRGLKWLLEAA